MTVSGQFLLAVDTAIRLARPALRLLGRLGKTGLLAGIASVVTSPTGQAVIRKVGGWFGRGLGWLARKTYSLVDKGLRLFGKPGNKAADAMFNAVVSVGGKFASIAAPVVHRVVRFTDPQSPLIRLISGLSKSLALHRLFMAVIRNPYLRTLLEGVVLPFVADSRLGQWVRRQVQMLRDRASSLREQAETLTPRASGGRKGSTGMDASGISPEAPVAAGEDVPMPSWLTDVPTPINRAERRAQDRQRPRKPQRDS